MLLDDPLQFIILAGAMDAALVHLGIRREFRRLAGSTLDLGFGGKPVVKIMAGGVAALRADPVD